MSSSCAPRMGQSRSRWWRSATEIGEVRMRRIGNDQALGEIYDSAGNYWRIALPLPVVTGAILDPVLPIDTKSLREMPCMFREDHFDPTARIRRGRFYVGAASERPSMQNVLFRNSDDSVARTFQKLLFVYDEYQIYPGSKAPRLVALGSPDSLSLWLVATPPE